VSHPIAIPFDQGRLDVGDGHRIFWEAAGNPRGKPAVILHGGPGSGSSPRTSRMFDPGRYLIVRFDQRQCGLSTPSAAEPVVDLSTNTTAHLLADIERLRTHLGIERWLVWGGSWGCTLALAYGEAHPERVSELVLASVTNGTRREIDWITRAMGRVFPEAWERFVAALPPDQRDGDLCAAYARLLADPDPAVHGPAAAAWCAWEDTHVATAPGHTPHPGFDDPAFRLGFARLVTHYWSHDCFLADGQLLADADRLAGIPGLMVHGRLDISGPADTAYALAKRWPDARLVIVEDAGHGGGGDTVDIISAATDDWAR
jgi:proline iminopeptidase